ncbi:MAG TPA: B-box zinc finger protein [Candidatus Hydrogenedentes bacterium]|nr:B-box zinc finger protein [Candidatus Hydrogenedentota bacterium]
MVDATRSGCINHPGVEATVRCKQCGTPVCNTCVVIGPTGRFCSAACQQRHVAFTQRAQQFEGKGRSNVFMRLRNVVGALIVVAAVAGAVLVVGYMFEVPVLKDIAQKALVLIGKG